MTLEPTPSQTVGPYFTIGLCRDQQNEVVPGGERDGTATWSLNTLQRALRRAADGLPQVSTYTIGAVLHDAGITWQRHRTWCETGVALRKRKHGEVTVYDPDASAKKA